jgi:hypothetical protein
MKFKNEFERSLFDAALRACGDGVSIEHNKIIQIEDASAVEVASFVGPPKKEIDVITAGFKQRSDVKVLISAKDYASKAEPADVQEWGAVVRTMNKYSAGTKYLGIVVSRGGFTSGCEPWAGCENLGLIPPLKGKILKFGADRVIQMLERVLRALEKRLHFPHEDLFTAPQYYDFVYRLTEAFEGREAAAKEQGERYRLLGNGWLSSFPELFQMLDGKRLQKIVVTKTGIYLSFSENLSLRMIGKQLQFGSDDGKMEGMPSAIRCEKNFFGEHCSFKFLNDLVVGECVTSAGDWGDRFELGLTNDLMLAVELDRLQVYRTGNPVDQNLL